jgi:hypothetical protein
MKKSTKAPKAPKLTAAQRATVLGDGRRVLSITLEEAGCIASAVQRDVRFWWDFRNNNAGIRAYIRVRVAILRKLFPRPSSCPSC